MIRASHAELLEHLAWMREINGEQLDLTIVVTAETCPIFMDGYALAVASPMDQSWILYFAEQAAR